MRRNQTMGGETARSIARAAFVLFAILVGCSSDDKPGGIRDAEVPNDAITDGVGGDGKPAACNSLTADGPEVVAERVSVPLEAPVGGTITDGTYVLTKFETTRDLPSGSLRLRQTITVAGTKYQEASLMSSNHVRANADLVLSGDSLEFKWTCNVGIVSTVSSGKYRYTATASELKVMPDATVLLTYTKK